MRPTGARLLAAAKAMVASQRSDIYKANLDTQIVNRETPYWDERDPAVWLPVALAREIVRLNQRTRKRRR